MKYVINTRVIEILENHEPLVQLKKTEFILEPKYHLQGLSDDPRIFLREGVYLKLLSAQKSLKPYRFKIWDGWRSRDVQEALYTDLKTKFEKQHPDWDQEKLLKELHAFVFPPDYSNEAPPHSTGGAVDCTLTNATGAELEMGTTFDHLGPESESDYFADKPAGSRIHKNRLLLSQSLEAQGLIQYVGEWWHFDYGNQHWAEAAGLEIAVYGEIKSVPINS